MKHHFLSLLLSALVSIDAVARQRIKLQGKIVDEHSNEPLAHEFIEYVKSKT